MGWLFSGQGWRCVRHLVPAGFLAVALTADDHGVNVVRQAGQGRIGDQPVADHVAHSPRRGSCRKDLFARVDGSRLAANFPEFGTPPCWLCG